MGGNALSQVVVSDRSTGRGLPFAHAKRIGSNIGIVSDERGVINMQSVPTSPSAKWVISYLGYWSDTLVESQLRKLDTVRLHPASLLDGDSPFVLEEVVVMPQTALELMRMVRKRIPATHEQSSHQAKGYYLETSYENRQLLSQIEALTMHKAVGYQPFQVRKNIHPDSVAKRDSNNVVVWIKGVRQAEEVKTLGFMQKERDKSLKKGERKAIRKEEEFDVGEYEVPTHLTSPVGVLKLDPLRHIDTVSEMKRYEVGVFDKANESDYHFEYGTPVREGDRWLIIIEFDQKDGVKRSMLKGKMWIDQSSKALVRIDMGLSPKGLKYLIPGPVDAALWLYGLEYNILDNQLSYTYHLHNGHYQLYRASMSATFKLKKRRIFGPNEQSHFRYLCTYKCWPSDDDTTGLVLLDRKAHLDELKVAAREVDWQTWMRAAP